MIDWDALMGEPSRQSVPVCPSQNSPRPNELGQPKPALAKASREIVPVVPIVPVKNQGSRLKEDARGVGVAVNLCASEMKSNDDDRIVCTSCGNLNDNDVCQIARPVAGAVVVAVRGYRPPLDRLQRCRGFEPLPSAEDQRNGVMRWPCL